ncbi:MAG: AAA family ATPase [Planctomycetota bacterium]|nr:MAG: AAA family ATPase [Planctomycetota bacterium]
MAPGIPDSTSSSLRPSAEERYRSELATLASQDQGPKPAGWQLSPRAVRDFVCGAPAKSYGCEISRKFYGDDSLVERAVVTLAGNRGLLLVGEPGTAKSMLSELLSAAISGASELVIQGTAATTEEQICYSWNYALLLAEGPSERALVPSPVHRGMSEGRLVRFEEITRCPPEVQDTMVGILSEKMLTVPELSGEAGLVRAKPGFNILATANIRDRGVHEMSAALKRRFNFETVHPIAELADEVELVRREASQALEQSGAAVDLREDVVAVLVEAFQDLRSGTTHDGVQVDRPSTVLSTAEAVGVCMSAGLDGYYYGNGELSIESLARHLVGAVFKDDVEDLKKLRHYLQTVARKRGSGRSKKAKLWKALEATRRQLRG